MKLMQETERKKSMLLGNLQVAANMCTLDARRCRGEAPIRNIEPWTDRARVLHGLGRYPLTYADDEQGGVV